MRARKQRGPTLVDVAAEAGVSIATASRALNGSTRTVRPDLAQAVREAAARLNYSPNAQAQAMARGRTDVVGLVVSDISDPYFSSIAAGVATEADAHRLLVSLCATGRDPEREIDFLTVLRGQRARAVILAGSRSQGGPDQDQLETEIARTVDSGARVVGITQDGLEVDTVVLDNRGGAQALATAVAGQGYRQAAVLAGPEGLLTAVDRTEGFASGFVAAGGAEPRTVHGAFTRDGGYAAMQEVLAGGDRPECVFAVNDVMAMGAMAACRDAGLTLPDDMAICGFDDIPTLRDVSPALTTVRLPLEEIGRAAMAMALEEPADTPRVHRVEGVVELRESTPPR